MLSVLCNSSRPDWILLIESEIVRDEDGMTTLLFLVVGVSVLSVLSVFVVGVSVLSVLGVGVPLLSVLSVVEVGVPLLSDVSVLSSPLGVAVGVTVGAEVRVTFWNGDTGSVVTAGSVLFFS